MRVKACNFIKIESLAQVFSCEFCEISKNTFFTEQLRRLLLLVVTHLNINSLRFKFDSLVQKITGNDDIFMISETKLDNSFPEGRFLIEGYCKPHRIDCNCHRGGIMLNVRADIHQNFYPQRRYHNPNKNTIESYLELLHKGLALYSSNYENIIV